MGTQPRKAKAGTPVLTDLGIIQVSSLNGTDTIILSHSQAVLFTVKCRKGKLAGSYSLGPEFKKYDTSQVMEAGAVYINWKRKTMPEFKLEMWRGKTADGHTHPWKFHARRHDSPSPDRTV